MPCLARCSRRRLGTSPREQQLSWQLILSCRSQSSGRERLQSPSCSIAHRMCSRSKCAAEAAGGLPPHLVCKRSSRSDVEGRQLLSVRASNIYFRSFFSHAVLSLKELGRAQRSIIGAAWQRQADVRQRQCEGSSLKWSRRTEEELLLQHNHKGDTWLGRSISDFTSCERMLTDAHHETNDQLQ